MHDDQLQRRLRAVLHDEAGRLPFTITTPELERRAALRGRGAGNRRLTILLAAALAIGGLGVGGLVGGLRDTESPAPSTPVTADGSNPPTTPRPGARLLPSLDELFALNRATVLIAQAHGPAEGPASPSADGPYPPASAVSLGTVHGGSDYRISVACLGATDLELDVRQPGRRGMLTGPIVRCDGSVVEETVRLIDAASVSLYFQGQVSWRVVVRGDLQPLPLPTANPVLPPAAEGLQELVRFDDSALNSTEPWGETGLRIQGLDAVPARMAYGARLWCPFGDAVRLILGREIDGALTADTETHLACDGTIHDLHLGIPAPSGTQVFVAADPGTRFSLLVTSEEPPIELLSVAPGWQLTTGFGPHLSFDDTPHSLSGVGQDGGGRVGIGFVCSGTEPIVVTVELGQSYGERRDRFIAPCTPEGSTTFEDFEVETSNATLTYVEPPGTWTAQSFFVPAASPAP